MNEDVALRVTHVSKNFRLPHEKTMSIKSGVVNIFRRRNKTVATQHALRDISFEVKKGEFFGILGRNGGGKSTMLKILADIYQPTKGKVERAGKLVPFIELGVGFNPELTGRENVYLNGALLGFSRKEISERYDDIVAFAELEEFMDQKLKNYSSGMQVRLAFSVATRAEADILLVDEVLAVGDADFQRKCFQYFRQLKKQKKTVIFVSHDMNSVREFCDRAILIDQGVIVFEGEAPKVANEYMRLFNDPDRQAHKSRNDEAKLRWGAGPAKIDAVTADVDDERINISMKVKSETLAEDVVVGLRIKNSAGKNITGTNTLIGEHKPFSIVPGKEKLLEWQFDNIFSTDMYAIDVTVRLGDGTICDNWDNAAMFEVVKSYETPYTTAPATTLKIQEKTA
jgi:ABC-2 type transport system ATP-binding protein